jgi:DNA-binding CsgD family transcriptional regulator
MCYSIRKGNLFMSNELAVHDPNQIKNNLVVRNPSEFAKPDKTRQVNGLNPPLPSDARADPVALRGSPPSPHAEGYDKTRQQNAIILEPKQEKAVELMLTGYSDTEIAKKINITRQTVNYWRNQDRDFIYELQMRRNQIWEGYRDDLSDLYKLAVEEIKKNLKSKDPKIRLQIAMQIVRLPALQENLKNKASGDPKTIKEAREKADLSQALAEVTEELGLN